MATAGIISGTNFRMYVAGLPVGYATSASIDTTAETREAIHKDAAGNGWANVTIGQLSGTCSVEGFMNEDAATAFASATNAPADLFTLFSSKTLVGCTFQGSASGDTKYTFNAYITSYNVTTPVEDNSTYSIALTVSGEITQTTVT
jgi:TP901-1 family phage major tail protein